MISLSTKITIKYNIGVSEQAEQAINHLNKGLSELIKIVSEQDYRTNILYSHSQYFKV